MVLPSEDMNIRRIGQIRAGFLAWNSALNYISRKLLAEAIGVDICFRRGDEAADKIAVYRVKVFLFELF